MPASVDLVTTAEVKTFLGLTGSTHDTLIGVLIDLVSEFIEDFCQTHFSDATITEKIDGGGEWLITTRSPIISITSITDTTDSSVTSSSDYTFYAKSGMIYLTDPIENDTIQIHNKWPVGKQRFSVVYHGGYATIPNAVKWVAFEVIARTLKALPDTNGAGRWTQPPIKSFEDSTPNVGVMALTPQERFLLAPYRRIEV